MKPPPTSLKWPFPSNSREILGAGCSPVPNWARSNDKKNSRWTSYRGLPKIAEIEIVLCEGPPNQRTFIKISFLGLNFEKNYSIDFSTLRGEARLLQVNCRIFFCKFQDAWCLVLYIDILIQSHKGIKIVSLFILPEAFVGVSHLSKLILLSGGFNFTNHLACRNTRKYWEDLPGSSYCILHWNKRHVHISNRGGGGTGHHQLFLVKFGVLEPAKSRWFRPKPEASYQSSIGKGFGHQTVKRSGSFGPILCGWPSPRNHTF